TRFFAARCQTIFARSVPGTRILRKPPTTKSAHCLRNAPRHLLRSSLSRIPFTLRQAISTMNPFHANVVTKSYRKGVDMVSAAKKVIGSQTQVLLLLLSAAVLSSGCVYHPLSRTVC